MSENGVYTPRRPTAAACTQHTRAPKPTPIIKCGVRMQPRKPKKVDRQWAFWVAQQSSLASFARSRALTSRASALYASAPATATGTAAAPSARASCTAAHPWACASQTSWRHASNCAPAHSASAPAASAASPAAAASVCSASKRRSASTSRSDSCFKYASSDASRSALLCTLELHGAQRAPGCISVAVADAWPSSATSAATSRSSSYTSANIASLAAPKAHACSSLWHQASGVSSSNNNNSKQHPSRNMSSRAAREAPH